METSRRGDFSQRWKVRCSTFSCAAFASEAPSADTGVDIEPRTDAGTPWVFLLPTTADAPPASTLEGPVLHVSLFPAFVSEAPSVDTGVDIDPRMDAGTPWVSLLPTTADASPASTLEGPVLTVFLCPALSSSSLGSLLGACVIFLKL